MRKLFLFLSCITIILSLASCGDNKKPQTAQAPISDPFAAESSSTKKSVSDGSFKIKSSIIDEFTYSGGSIPATQDIANGGTDITMGFLTLIDGIPQNASESKDILPKISMKANEQYTLPIEITPNCGKKGETLRMDTLSMFQPDFVPEKDKFTFGNYHNAMAGFPIQIHFEVSSETKEFTIFTEYSIRNPTDAENSYHDLANGTATIFGLLQDENRSYLVAENNSVKFNFMAYSAHSETFRISLYKNHIPVKINGCDVADIKVSKGRVTELPIVLDDIKPGDFIYAIATPMTNLLLTPDKTPSMMIMDKDFTMPVDKSSASSSNQLVENSGLIFLNADATSQYFYKYLDGGKVQVICKNHDNTITAESEPITTDMVKDFSPNDNLRFTKTIMNDATAVVTLDDKLQLVSQLDLKELGINKQAMRSAYLDILGNKQLFKNNDRNISIYDFDTQKTTVVPKNDSIESNKVGIVGMRFLTEQKIAFVSQIFEPVSYNIGVLDISNNKVVQKPLKTISTTFNTANGVACWNSKRMDKDEVSDGIIHLYYNNDFHEIKCATPNESQNVFLSNDGEQVATYYATESDLIISVYDVKNGKKVFEKTIKLNDGYNSNNTKLCIAENKIYIYDGSGDKLFEVFNLEG